MHTFKNFVARSQLIFQLTFHRERNIQHDFQFLIQELTLFTDFRNFFYSRSKLKCWYEVFAFSNLYVELIPPAQERIHFPPDTMLFIWCLQHLEHEQKWCATVPEYSMKLNIEFIKLTNHWFCHIFIVAFDMWQIANILFSSWNLVIEFLQSFEISAWTTPLHLKTFLKQSFW